MSLGKEGVTGGSDLGIGDGQFGRIGNLGTELGWENEWELGDLSEDEGCKGQGIKVLLRAGDEVGITGDLAGVRNRGLRERLSGFWAESRGRTLRIEKWD